MTSKGDGDKEPMTEQDLNMIIRKFNFINLLCAAFKL